MMPKAYIVGLLVSLLCTIGQAQLLINGSFDEGTETTSYVSGNDTVTGWSHNGGTNGLMYHVNRDISNATFPKAAANTGPYYAGISASYIKNAYLLSLQTLGTMEIGQNINQRLFNNINGSAAAFGYCRLNRHARFLEQMN